MSQPSATVPARPAILVAAAVFIDVLLYGVVVPVVPRYAHALGAGPAVIGTIFAAYAVGMIAASPPAASLTARVGPRRSLVLAGLGLVLSTIVWAVGGDIGVLIAARAIQGAAAAVTWTAGLAFVAAAYGPRRRGQLMGWIMTAMAAGSVLGAPAGGLLADALGYRAPFLATAALGGGEVVAVLLLFPDWRAARPETASAGRLAPAPRTTGPGGRFSRLLAGNGASRYPLAAVLAASIAVSAVEPLLPLHLKAAMGASPGVIGLLFGVAMGAYAVASPLAGALTDRIGPAGPITAGLAGLAVVTAALPHARSIPAVTVLLGGLGICLCAVLTAATTWLGTVADGMGERGYARAYALFNIVYASGMLLGPVQAGLITQAASLSVALAATGAICLVTVLPAVAVAGWRRALRRVPLSTEAAGPGETVPEAAPGASGAGGR